MSKEQSLECSVLQGSCSGPVTYNLYASTLKKYIENDIANILGYADDHLVFDSFTAGDLEEENECIASLEHGIDKI